MSQLRDQSGHWVVNLPITEQLRDDMIVEIVNRIHKKLDATKALLNVSGHEEICGGLFTFALEEYGKVVLLQNYKNTNNTQIEYRNKFLNHKEKLKLAEAKLPKECMELHGGAFDRNGFDSKGFDVNVIADIDSRLGIFFTDFTNPAVKIKRFPSVDKPTLTKAIQSFEKYLESQTFP